VPFVDKKTDSKNEALPFKPADTAEIDQDSNLEPRHFQIVDKLAHLSRRQARERLDLDNDLIKADKVGNVSMLKLVVFVVQYEFALRVERY